MAGKMDLQQILLDKGEKIAIAVAGGLMLLFAILGLSMFTGTADPEAKAKEIEQSAKSLQARMVTSDAEPPPLVEPKFDASYIASSKYPQTNLWVDPISQPETKRVNPKVLAPIEFQVDMVHAKIRSYDMVPPNMIGFVVPAKSDPKDKKPDLKKWQSAYKSRFRGRPNFQGGQPGMMNPPGQPGGGGPMAGGGGFGPPSSGGPMGGGFGPPSSGNPMGGGRSPMGSGGDSMGMMMPGGNYDMNAQRSEIIYVSMDDDFDRKVPPNARLAETIFPERVVVVNASFPYRQQLEEFKKALRLKNVNEVLMNPDFEPIFRGINVERKVLNAATGALVEDWKPLDYIDNYRRKIFSRKIGDQPDDPNLAYVMLPPSYQLVMPLPELVDSQYPPVKLPSIDKEVRKILDSMKIPATPSAMAKKFKGEGDIFSGLDASNEYGAYMGGEGMGPMGGGGPRRPGGLIPGQSQSPYMMGGGPMGPGGIRPMPPGGGPRGSEGEQPYAQMTASQDPLEVCLIRFLDANIQPGRIYQYKIQVKIQNPNWGKKEDVQRKQEAEVEVLFGEPVIVTHEITDNQGEKKRLPLEAKVPIESFLYAVDMPAEKKAAQVREGEAMVQIQQWRAEIKLTDRIREPVGDWVIAEFPVMRGEYVGQKQMVKLPLWSSALNAYILRDVNTAIQKNQPKRDPKDPPKGVLMDFTRNDRVVVEVEGGKLEKTVVDGLKRKKITDESATEILIIEEDSGKLRVLNTSVDQDDQQRIDREKKWKDWVKLVEDATKMLGPNRTGGNNPFARPEDGGP